MSASEPLSSNASSNLPRIGSQFCCKTCKCPSKDIDQTGGCLMCGETKSIRIIDEMKHFYEERMRHLRAHPAGDSDQVHLLEQWVTDLHEQNKILLGTVEELEKASCHRVALLEGKLNESSLMASNFMRSSKELIDGIEGSGAERAGLEKRVGHLESDIRSLCTLIRQVRLNNNWCTDGMTFFEVTMEDIFGSSSCQCGHEDTVMLLAHKDEQILDLVKKIQTLEDEMLDKASLAPREEAQTNDNMVYQLEADLRRAEFTRTNQYKDILELSRQLKDSEIRIDYAQREKKQVADELASVHRELHFKVREVEALNQAIANIEKSSKDMQAALTAEVADKHDLLSQMRRECQQLEERCHQADMQINFKDGIIKEMRKEIKFNRCKIAELEEGLFVKNVETDRTIVQGQSLVHGKPNASIRTLIEQPASMEKQTRSRPKVSKFFQPNTGDYIVSSGHPYGDSNENKPSFLSAQETVKKVASETRSSSPPSKDIAAREGKVTSLADEELCSLKLSLKTKDEVIAQLQAKIAATKLNANVNKHCICKLEPNSAVDEERMNVDKLIGKLCKCNGDEHHIGLQRIFANLQTSLSLAYNDLSEAREMYLNNERRVGCSDDLDNYGARFQNEEVATDEMKEAMNNLIADLKTKKQQINDQELIIQHLRSELRAGKLSKANKKLSVKCSPCVTFKESEIPQFPTKSKRVDFDYNHPHCLNDGYQALDHSASIVQAMSEKLEKRDAYIALQAEIITLLQTMLQEAEELQEENCFHRSCVMKQTYLRQQDRIEELMKCLADLRDEGMGHRKHRKREKRPPKILRARSVEEFRVKTVESQAAVEDLNEVIEALLNNLYCRENKLNELDKFICTLQQSLSVYAELIRKLLGSGKKCLKKQTTDLEFCKKTERIQQLQRELDNCLRTMSKFFDKLMADKEHANVAEYQTSANECHRVMSNIAAEVNSAIHSLAICREQQELSNVAMSNEQQPLEQVELNVATVQAEVRNYLKFKKDSEKCREDLQCKIEKLQAELENAQEELRRNVENYNHTDYTVPGVESSCNCSSVEPRISPSFDSACDCVNREQDAHVRSAMEKMKQEINALTEKLEQHERHNADNEEKLELLQRHIRSIEDGHHDAIDPKVNISLEQRAPTSSDDTAALHKALDITQMENARLRAALEPSKAKQPVEVFEHDRTYNKSITTQKYTGPKNLVLFQPSTSSRSSMPGQDSAQRQARQEKNRLREGTRQSLVLFEDEPRTSKVKFTSSETAATQKYVHGLETEIANLQQSSRNSPSVDQARTYSEKDFGTLQRALEVSQQKVADLEQALRDVQKKRMEADHSEEEIANHCEAICLLQRTLDKTEHELHGLHKQIQLLYKEKGASEMAIESLARALRAAEEEVRRSKLALPNLQELRRSIVSEYCIRCGRLEAELVRAREGPCHCCQATWKQNKQSDPLVDQRKCAEIEELKTEIANQQTTISNLKQALLSTKQQLEELQGKPLDVSGGAGGSWTWPKNGHVSKHTVHDV